MALSGVKAAEEALKVFDERKARMLSKCKVAEYMNVRQFGCDVAMMAGSNIALCLDIKQRSLYKHFKIAIPRLCLYYRFLIAIAP